MISASRQIDDEDFLELRRTVSMCIRYNDGRRTPRVLLNTCSRVSETAPLLRSDQCGLAVRLLYEKK